MKYIIFTTPFCKWCAKAKALLTLGDHEFMEVGMEKRSTHERYYPENLAFDIWASMGFTTVPQVFYGSTHIGGFEELKNHLNS